MQAWRVAVVVLALAGLLAAPGVAEVAPAGPQRLAQPALADATDVWTPQEWAARADGPTPGIQDGLGPGSAMQQSNPGGSFICTAAFLLRDPYTGVYYLSTAGHCLVRDAADPTPYTGAANPEKLDTEVRVCVAQCIDNALGLGEYVSIKATDGHHPITFAQSGGVGADFGIIELPADLHGELRPEMPSWGGPTGIASSSDSASLVVHYGHGSYCCPGVGSVASRTPADQARTGIYQGASATTWDALGSSSGGDSGSGVSLGVSGPDGLSGGLALGVLTHGSYVGHPAASLPIFTGTMLLHGLAMVQEHTGLQLELVPAGDPLPTTPTKEPPVALPSNITVTAPAAGATIDPAVKRVTIRGRADHGGGALANGTQVQVAVDDPGFGLQSRIIVSGNASWSGTWDLGGVANGQHTVRARLVAADGTVLDQHNVTVTLKKGAGTSSASGTGAGGGAAPGGLGSTSDGSGADSSDDGGPAKGAPGPAPPLLAAGLAALALARRRHGQG